MSDTVLKPFILAILLALLSCVESLKAEDDDEDSIFFSFGTLHTLDRLSQWAQKEEQLVKLFDKRVALIDREIDLITKYLKYYEESSGRALANLKRPIETAKDRGRVVGSSAILGHLMTDRLVTIMEELRRLFVSSEYHEVEEAIREELEVFGGSWESRLFSFKQWPSSNDLHMSLNSIMAIQETYNILPSEMSEGLTVDSNFGGKLAAFHGATLGQYGLTNGYYYKAIQWLEFALYQLHEDHDSNSSISEELVGNILQVAVQTHNRKLGSKKLDPRASLNLYTEYVNETSIESERVTMRKDTFEKEGAFYGNISNPELNALPLCNGNDFQPVEIKSRLKCHLERKRHPYFILNPLKMETLSEYPYVVQFYDIMGNDTIEEVITTRDDPQLSSIRLNAAKGLKLDIRSSAGSILPEEIGEKIRQKAKIMTGLVADEPLEAIQIVEYVYGRKYGVHSDPLSFPEGGEDIILAESGNRVATILYYADTSPNLIGGYTPFCHAGISAYPNRGSAVYWLNMFRNGTVRQDIHHAACPVIHGRKIILNLWIRYNKNFQAFKCALDRYQ